jgi:hypothetical protein
MEDRPLKSRVVRPGQGNIRETIGCLGLLILFLIAAKIVSVLHDRPYYRSDIVTAQPSDETVKKAAAQGIPVAATEESLREFADAITDPDWATALIKGQAVFLVPGGTRFAILRRDLFGWSISHPLHAGVVLNVRVIDGENAGKTGYLMAAWSNITDRGGGRPSITQTGTRSVGQPGRIISRRPSDLSADDATAIIRAAIQAIMQAHPDMQVGNGNILITNSMQQDAYDIALPVYWSTPPQAGSAAHLMVSAQPAKCTVRRAGGKWTAEVIYFPTNEPMFDFSGVK